MQIIFEQPLTIWLIDDGQSPNTPKPEVTVIPPCVGDCILHKWTLNCELIYEIPSEGKRPHTLIGKRIYMITNVGLAFGGGGDQPWEGEGVEGAADAFEIVLNHQNGENFLWGITYSIPTTTFYFISVGASGVWTLVSEDEYWELCPEERPNVDEEPFEFNLL